MTALSIQPPYPIFTESDGSPLENGYLYIGTANLDPVANPIAVYWDAALTVAAAQPIRTLNGYPSRNGTPARLYVGSDYSIRVNDSKGVTVYSAPAATERLSGVVIEIDSSDVAFLPAGSGAVSRTTQDKLREFISPEDYGAIGNNVADDSTAWQNCVNAASGRPVLCSPGKTYLCLNEIIVPSTTQIDLCGSEVRFDVVGNKYGFKLGSRCLIENGTIRHINTTNEPGVNGSFRSCVTVGSFNANPGTGDNGVSIERIDFYSARPNGQCLSIYSDSFNVEVRNCRFFDSGTAKQGIAAHWSLETGTPAGGTRHPGMVTVENCQFSDFDVGIYLSAAYGFRISGCRFLDCIKGVEFYRGDYSDAYSLQSIGPAVGRAMVLEGSYIRGATIGVEIDGIEGLVAPQQLMGVTIRDCLIFGRTIGASTDQGIYVRGTSRVSIHDCEIAEFDGYGIDFFGDCQNITVRDCIIRGCEQSAIYSRDTDAVLDVAVQGCRIYMNAGSNPDSIKPHIRIGALCVRWQVVGCEFGASGETASVSIQMVPGNVSPVIRDNRTLFLAGGGWAYRVSGATSLATTAAMRMDYRNNSAAAGITQYDGSPCSEVFGPNANLLVYNDAAPTLGAWVNGDRVQRITRTAGQPQAWSCTVAGTPGTWVSEGNL